MTTAGIDTSVYRILDANLNRLREALRVVEEHFRFVRSDENASIIIKQMRHSLEQIEQGLGRANLLAHRDTETDPFAGENRPEELGRAGLADVMTASLKRAQEAARVIEEYAKLTPSPQLSGVAKKARFDLYKLEKDTHEAHNP